MLESNFPGSDGFQQMLASFPRTISLSTLLFLCVSGCQYSHFGCKAMVQHRHHHAGCGDTACGCTPPLYPGDTGSQCKKHSKMRPMQRVASTFRRNSPNWISGESSPGCTECGYPVSDQMAFGQTGCGQMGCVACGGGQVWQQGCFQSTMMSCDSMNSPFVDGWYYDESSVALASSCGSADCGGAGHGGEVFPGDISQSSGCGCTNQQMMQGVPNRPQVTLPNPPRSFSPSLPPNQGYEAPVPPGAAIPTPPMKTPAANQNRFVPQDVTPMDEPMPMPVPNDAPGPLFDPLDNEAAPLPPTAVDPVSFEVPHWDPIPVPKSRVGNTPIRH